MRRVKGAKGLFKILLVFALVVPVAFSPSPGHQQEALAASPIESVVAGLVPNDPPGVPNPNSLIGDREILQALDFWIRGRPVPGASVISDQEILRLLDLWIRQTPVAPVPSIVKISGRLIPAEKAVSASSFEIINTYEAVTPAADGSFTISVQTQGVTLLGALPPQGENLYLAISVIEGSQPTSSLLTVDARSTAEALAMMTLGASVRNPSTTAVVQAIVRNDSAVDELAEFIERTYRSGANLLDTPKFTDLLIKAVDSVRNRLPSKYPQSQQTSQFVTLSLGKAEKIEIDLDLTRLRLLPKGSIVELDFINKPGTGIDWYAILEELDPKDIASGLEFIKNATNRTKFSLPKRQLATSVIEAQAHSQYFDVLSTAFNALVDELNLFSEKDRLQVSGDTAGVYILRAYSGGGWKSQDPLERDFVKNDIPQGATNLTTAFVINILMALLDAFDFVVNLKVFDKREKIDIVRTIYTGCIQSLVTQSVESEKSLWGPLKDCLVNVITKIAEKFLEISEKNFFKKLGKFFKKVGKILVKIVDIAGRLSSAGLVFERLKTLVWDATAVESAIIVIGDPWESVKRAPTASFVYDPSYPQVGSTVQFSDRSTDPDNDIQSWFWDFGDGTTSSSQNPTHTYTRIGSFTVTLTVKDKAGNTATTQQTIQVQEKPSSKPTASFTFTPANPRVNQTVRFTDQSSDPDNDIQSWFWDFGDGKTSSSQNPIYTYSRTGAFTVTLTVRDKAGNIATVQKIVNVQEQPKPFVYISKTIRSDSDSIIDLTSSNSNDGSRDVIFRVTITNDGDAEARVRIADDMAGGSYRCADPSAPCERDNVLVKARSSFTYDYRARYVGSETRDGATVVNTARIVWIDGYYDESRRIDLGGHGTLSSSVTAYLRNPPKPKARPEIISIDLPREIPSDNSPRTGRINFRDPDGDINWIEFKDASGGFVTGAWDPGVFGITSGTIAFDQRCNTPQTFTIRVTLRDRAGNESDPAYFSFTCVKPSSPPEIVAVNFPAEIPSDGSRVNGTVRFKDPDGDISWVEFAPLSGNFIPFNFDPQVSGQTSGSIGFTIWCNEVQTVTLRVTLRDRAGNESAPFRFTFRCVAPVGPPVITRIDFPREIFANSQPVEGRVYFTSLNSNVNRAKFEVLTGTWNPIDFNPAQTLVSGTLQGGIFTFTVKCNSPENGRFRVTLYNEAGLASRSEEFTFICRPVYTDEICGNGIDDDGDGYIDEGCSTVSILLEDTGPIKDDVFRLFIDGVEIPPDTPVGGRRYYSIDGLYPGRHTVEVFVIRDIDPPGTFTLTLLGGAYFEGGGTQHDCMKSSRGCPGRGESRIFTIVMP